MQHALENFRSREPQLEIRARDSGMSLQKALDIIGTDNVLWRANKRAKKLLDGILVCWTQFHRGHQDVAVWRQRSDLLEFTTAEVTEKLGIPGRRKVFALNNSGAVVRGHAAQVNAPIATVHAPMWHHKSVVELFQVVLRLLADLIALAVFALRQRQATAAENLVLRRQLALYQERGIKARRIDAVTRISLALLSRLFNWRGALVVVRPETMLRWHRAGWKLFWRRKSRPGRPSISLEIRAMIRRMANESPAWGEERIANEFLVNLEIRLSPRTVSKYLSRRPPGRPRGDLHWSTFLRLHAQGIIACDFLVAVTATFRLLYVFVVIEHHSRRLIHCNVTAVLSNNGGEASHAASRW
jgi:hypothetical protein